MIDTPATAGPPGLARRPFYGWKLLAVFWVILLANLGFPMYGGAFLNSAMAAELHFSRQTLGLPFSVFLGTVGLSSPLVAVLIRRIGVRLTLVLGNVSVALGALAMGTVVTTGVAAIIVFGLVIGFGVAAGGNLTAQTAIPRWFIRRRSLAFAIMLTAAATGGFIAPPFLNAIIGGADENWAVGWLVLAAIATSAAFLAGVFVRESPEEVGQAPDGDNGLVTGAAAAATSLAAQSVPLREAARTLRFWMLVLASSAATGSFGLILAHGVANARDAGSTGGEAAFALALVSLLGFGGKAIAGSAGDRMGPATVWGTLMIVMAFGLGVLAWSASKWGIYFGAASLGLGFGGVVVCQPATIAKLFGAHHFAPIASTIYFLQAIAGILVPWIAGRTFDRLNTYAPGFFGASLACLAAGALLLFLLRHPAKADR